LGHYSEPVPDIALVRPRADDYLHRHPSAADVFLFIEVSDTSLRYDVDVKVPLYAKHGIPEVWVVDLADRRRRARSGVYQTHETADETALVAAVDLPQARVDFSIVLAG